MSTILRILRFKQHDWNHIWWLFTRMIEGYFEGNLEKIVDAWSWIRIHCMFDNTFIPTDKEGKVL